MNETSSNNIDKMWNNAAFRIEFELWIFDIYSFIDQWLVNGKLQLDNFVFKTFKQIHTFINAHTTKVSIEWLNYLWAQLIGANKANIIINLMLIQPALKLDALLGIYISLLSGKY